MNKHQKAKETVKKLVNSEDFKIYYAKEIGTLDKALFAKLKTTITKKENPINNFMGILKGKTKLTSKEFIKLKKKDCKL